MKGKFKKLNDFAEYRSDRVNSDLIDDSAYITTDSFCQNLSGIENTIFDKPKNFSITHYKKNDTAIANIRPYLQKIWLCNKSGGASADVLILNAKEGNSSLFVHYSLKRKHFFDYVMSGSKGTKMPRGDKSHIMCYPLLDVNQKEQNKLSQTLHLIDEKIDLNNRINAELKATAKLIYNYWFVQFDFPISKEQATAMGNPSLEGKPYKSNGGKMTCNPQLKREIPEGWEMKKLSGITELNNDQIDPSTKPEKKYKHQSIPSFDACGTYYIEKGSEIGSNKFVIGSLDLLISKLNPKFNRVIYSMGEEDLIASTEFVVWKTKSKWQKDFLYQIATHSHFIEYCKNNATGTSNSHKRVNPTVMMNYKVPFNESTQESYGEKIGCMVDKINSNNQQNRELTTLRDWLLPMLMNGQVTVNSEFY